MIPIIYPNNETAFTTRGYGALSDCISCAVTEELNGAYTLELKYPKNGLHQEQLLVRNIIVAQSNRSKDREAFRIYKVDRRLKDYITVYANQLSYDLSGYMTIPATVTNIIFALQHLASGSGSGIGNFILNTTITSASSFRVDVPSSVRSWFGGKEGSLIDVYGGEWSYDFWTCSLLTSRGADNGVRVSYGVNLADYQKQQEDNMYSHVVAYYASTNAAGVLEEFDGSEVATGATDIHRTLILNATSDYYNIGVVPTPAELTTYATNYVAAHGSELVGDSQTITVAPEILATQEIDLGDTVHVAYNNDLLSTRVVKTIWNTLAEKYDSITLGTKKTSIAETIKSLTLGGPSTGDIVIDNALNGSSTHPVQNKVIKNALDEKVNTSSVSVTDISSSFSFTLGSGSGSAYVKYDSLTKTVRGTFQVTGATAFNTTANMFTVASAYRPTAEVSFACMIQYSSGWAASLGRITTAGYIRQRLSTSATSCYGYFEYTI